MGSIDVQTSLAIAVAVVESTGMMIDHTATVALGVCHQNGASSGWG